MAAKRAIEFARENNGRGEEIWARRLSAEISAHSDPPDVEAATRHYREALTRAMQLEMRPLAAHCHLGLGKLYRRTGDPAKAEEHLTTASTMYREMDLGFWLEKAERSGSSSVEP
jgi:hypothetical protein